MNAATRDPIRAREIKAIHTAKRALALDDGTYRALLARVAGKDSSKDMSAEERRAVLDEFRRLGFTPKRAERVAATAPRSGRPVRHSLGDGGKVPPQHFKVRSLWHAAYLLGAVDHPDDRALDAFAKRTAAVDALRFAAPAQANKIVEALKAMCGRHGYDVPDRARVDKINAARKHASLPPARYGHAADIDLVVAVWRKLIARGAMRTGAHARLDSWFHSQGWGAKYEAYLTEDQARLAAERLGAWLRGVPKKD